MYAGKRVLSNFYLFILDNFFIRLNLLLPCMQVFIFFLRIYYFREKSSNFFNLFYFCEKLLQPVKFVVQKCIELKKLEV